MAILPPINALGTQFLIEIWDEVAASKLEMVKTRLEFLLSEFENNYSRFKPDSQISLLNQHKIITNPTSELITLLRLGITYFDKTNGIHNLMVGEKLVASGYDADYSFTAKQVAIKVPNPHDVLSINDTEITLKHGQIDLGGYGKGFAIDVLAHHLQNEFGLKYFLINGGGDMYGTSNHGEPITLYLEHPTEPQTYLGTTTILNQGFAASSTHKRSWIYNGTTYHHIINAQSKTTTAKIPDASFVIASDATTADVFATVVLLANPAQMNQLDHEHTLAVALFASPHTLTHNQLFNVQPL
jgi:FAD:protein FMN transferase